MKERFPEMNILAITEGIDTSKYIEGKNLNERSIDLLEFGRRNKKVFDVNLPQNYTHLYSKNGEHLFKTEQDLMNGLADSKITICYPRCDTQPQKAGDIETLTQRYWEAMLSQIVIVGRAPKELIDLIGYNPVIEIGKENQKERIRNDRYRIYSEDAQDRPPLPSGRVSSHPDGKKDPQGPGRRVGRRKTF
jgi:hypothetical protein